MIVNNALDVLPRMDDGNHTNNPMDDKLDSVQKKIFHDQLKETGDQIKGMCDRRIALITQLKRDDLKRIMNIVGLILGIVTFFAAGAIVLACGPAIMATGVVVAITLSCFGIGFGGFAIAFNFNHLACADQYEKFKHANQNWSYGGNSAKRYEEMERDMNEKLPLLKRLKNDQKLLEYVVKHHRHEFVAPLAIDNIVMANLKQDIQDYDRLEKIKAALRMVPNDVQNIICDY